MHASNELAVMAVTTLQNEASNAVLTRDLYVLAYSLGFRLSALIVVGILHVVKSRKKAITVFL